MSDRAEMKRQHEDECVASLLQGVPEIATIKRETLEKVIRSAFSGGWKLAQIADEIPEGSIQ